MIRVSGIQITTRAGRSQTLDRGMVLLHRAIEDGASIACFPELFTLPWFPAGGSREDAGMLAETIEGPTVASFREEALNHGMVIVAPFLEKDGERCFSSAAVILPDGSVAGVYRKVHVPQFPHWEEQSFFAPGDNGFPVFATPFGTIGVMIGWDVFFPESSRLLALAGAQIILAPTASAYGYLSKWDRSISAAAITNTVYIFRVNRVGKQDGVDFYGRTFCVDPHGDALFHPVEMEEGIYTVDLDIEGLEPLRRNWSFLAHRRPDQYGPLSDPPGD